MTISTFSLAQLQVLSTALTQLIENSEHVADDADPDMDDPTIVADLSQVQVAEEMLETVNRHRDPTHLVRLTTRLAPLGLPQRGFLGVATLQSNLSQADIIHLVAKHYDVKPSDVTLHISPGYSGGPTDSEPASVTATVNRGEESKRSA